jgi:thioredoxin reductase (NADPH)
MHKVVIIGSGCAGNTAAVYTGRAGLEPLVIKGHEVGGQLSLTTEVENFPGFPEGINGPDLIENMKRQAERFGAIYRDGQVTEADLSKRPFRLKLEDEWIETRTLIVASGAKARWLDLPSEQKLIGHGVSSCATCDGFFYREKKIMVVGGGDSAMEEANFLTRFGREVALVHRRDQFRASKIMLERAKANPKIEFVMNTAVEEVYDLKQNMVTGVKLRNLVTGETWERDVDGLFVAIGQIRRSSKASWTSIRTAICFRMAARGPISTACSMRATCRIASTGRPSQPPARAAWPRSKPNAYSKPRDIKSMIERLSPPGIATPRGPYSPAVRAGDFIFLAGQVPVDPATNQMSTGDIQHETRITLNNVKRLLEGVGSSLADVVKVGVYLSDGADFAQMNEIYTEFFNDSKPARTTIVCKFMADIRIEVDCVAYTPKR